MALALHGGRYRYSPTGSHIDWIQSSPGSVQMPQLALQRTSPAAQVTGPQGSPAATQAAVAPVSWQRVPGGQSMVAHAPAAASFLQVP